MFKILKKLQERKKQEQSLITPKTSAPLRVVLCYPNQYSIGMANLGFQWVYKLFNDHSLVSCERAFYPDPSEEKIHWEKKIPVLALESKRPISEFDVIAFSFSYELDYLNALKMLLMSGIPLRSAQRRKGAGKKFFFPLLLGGGIAISSNPEPMADFFDLIVVGEAEAVIDQLIEALAETGKTVSLSGLGQIFSELEGIYLPSAYQPEYDSEGKLRQIKTLGKAPPQIKSLKASPSQLPSYQVIFSPQMEFSELGLIELMRGCRWGCRFCLAGYFYRPPRMADYHKVISAIEQIRKYRSRLGLISPVVPDWEGFAPLLNYLEREKISFSPTSLRVESISDKLLERMKASGAKTITLAPEVGSCSLQRFINKEIKEDKLLRQARKIAREGFEKIKLYYQVGFPEEGELAVDEIAVSIRRIKTALAMGAGRKKYPGTIEVSLNPFIPKPHTAFQWLEMEEGEKLEEKLKRLQSQLRKESGVEVKISSVRQAILQAIISRGDRELSSVLENLARGKISLGKIIKDPKLRARYLCPREKEELFPWEIIDTGVRKEYLWNEYERAWAEKTTPPCRKGCKDCGVC